MDNTVQGKKAGFAPIREDASRMIISYGMKPVGETADATWREVYLYKKKTPMLTDEAVKQAIQADINKRVTNRIVSTLVWNQKPVWLSRENQMDWEAALNRALQTEGANLPLKYKLGEDSEGQPVYHTFTSLTAFTDFWDTCLRHIHQCLQEGWAEKDSIDWDLYTIVEQPAADEQPAP